MTDALTRRSVDEWIASSPDAAIPLRVKLRVWERCGGKCALTGRKIRPGDAWQVDHVRALINGGQHRESNLQIVLSDAHKEKTRADVAERVKTDRMRAKHLGAWPKSKTPLKSRGFAPGRNRAFDRRNG